MNPLIQKESLEPIPFGYTLHIGGAERALRCLSIVVSCLSIIGLSLFVFSGFQKYCKETWEGKKWGPIEDAPADVQSTAETTDQFVEGRPPIKNTSQTLTPTPTLPPLTTPLEKESSPASLPVFNTPTSPQEETSPDKKIASAPTPTLPPLTTPDEEEVSPVSHLEKIEPFLATPLKKESSPASLPVFNTPTSPQEETSPDKKIASAPTPTLHPLTTPNEEEVSPVSIPIQPTPSTPTENSFIEEASISSLSPIEQELIPVQPSKEILKQAFTEVSQQIKNCQKGLIIVDVTPVNTLLQSDQTEEIKEVISTWAKVVEKGLQAEYALLEEDTVSTKDIRNICLLKNRILLLKKDLEKILSISDQNIFYMYFKDLYESILTFEEPLVLEDEIVRKRLENLLKFSKKNDPKEVHLAIAPLVSLLPESDDVREQAEKFITEFEKTFQKDFFALEQARYDLHNLSMQLLQASDPLDQLQLMQDTLYRIERFQELSKKLSCFNILLQSPSVNPKALSDSFIKSYQKVCNQAFLDFNLCYYHNLPIDSRDFQRVIKIITMLDQLKIATLKIDHFSQDLYAFGAKHELATNEKGTAYLRNQLTAYLRNQLTAYLRNQLKAVDIDTEKHTLTARPIVPVNISFFPSQTTFNALSRFWIQQDTPEYEREIKKWLESCQEYSHCLTEKEKEQILSEQEIFSQSNPQDQQISALSQKILREFSAKRKLQEEIQDCQLKQKQIRSGRWILPYSQEEQEQISILAEKERLLKQWTKYLQSLNQQIHRLRSSNSAHNTHYLPTQGNDALYTYGSEDDSVELVIAQQKRESDPKLLITPISLSSIDKLSEDAIFTVLSENIQAIEKQPTEEQRTSVLSALAILQSSAEHLQKENLKFSTIYDHISQTASLSETLANKDPLTATNIFTDAIQNLKPGKPLTFFGAWNRDTTPEPICYQIELTEEGLYHFSVEQENNPTLTLFLNLPKERITSFPLIAYLQGNTVDVSGRNVALAPLKALEQILGNPEVLSTQTDAKVQLPLERVLHLVCSSSDKSEQKEFLARTYYNFGNSALEKLSSSDTNSAQNISYRYRVLRMFIVALQYTQKDSPLTPLIQENIEKFIHYSTDVKKVPSIPLQSEPINSFFTNISYQYHNSYCYEDIDLYKDDKLPSHPIVAILTKDKNYTIVFQTKSSTLIEVGENPNKKTYHITTNANTQCLVHQKINGEWYQGKLIGNDQQIPLFLHNCIVWMSKEKHAIIEPTDHANPGIISKYKNEQINFYFINDLEHKIIKTPKEITDVFCHLAQPCSIITTGTDELLHKIYLTEQGLSCSVDKEDPTLLQFDHPMNYTLSLNTPQHSLFPEKNHLLLQKEGKNVILLRNSQQLNGEYILYQETSPGFFTPLDLEKEQAILATIHLAEKWADLGYFEKAIEYFTALENDFAKLSKEQKKSITDKIHSLLSRSKIDHPHIAEAAAFRIKLKQIFIKEADVDQEDHILYEKYRQALHSSLR